GFPFSVAAAISLTTVIATSSTVSASRAGKHLINMKLGMLLEVATAAGSFLGGVTAQFIAQSLLQTLFGFIAVVVAIIMLTRLRRSPACSWDRGPGCGSAPPPRRSG